MLLLFGTICAALCTTCCCLCGFCCCLHCLCCLSCCLCCFYCCLCSSWCAAFAVVFDALLLLLPVFSGRQPLKNQSSPAFDLPKHNTTQHNTQNRLGQVGGEAGVGGWEQSGSTLDWPNSVLAKLGQTLKTQTLAKVGLHEGLAKVGLAKVGYDRPGREPPNGQNSMWGETGHLKNC